MVYTVLTVRYLLTCRRWRREIFPCTQQRRLSAPTCHTGRSRARYPSPSSEQCAPSLPSDHFAASGLVLKCQISTLYSILITVSLWQRIFISCWKNLFLSTNQLFTYSRLVQAKSTREGRIPSTVAGRLKCWDIFVCTFCIHFSALPVRHLLHFCIHFNAFHHCQCSGAGTFWSEPEPV